MLQLKAACAESHHKERQREFMTHYVCFHGLKACLESFGSLQVGAGPEDVGYAHGLKRDLLVSQLHEPLGHAIYQCPICASRHQQSDLKV